MADVKRAKKDFKLLDSDLTRVEKRAGELYKMSEGSSEKKLMAFVHALRLLYESRSKLIGSARTTDIRAQKKARDEEANEKVVANIFTDIVLRKHFSTRDIVKNLQSSFDSFNEILNLQVRYHTEGTHAFTSLTTRINKRREMLKSMDRELRKDIFEGLLKKDILDKLREDVGHLLVRDYPKLIQDITSLNNLIMEFNARLGNINRSTADLDMIKGISLKKPGFFGGLFSSSEEIMIPEKLTESDKRRIHAIQSMVNGLHNTTVQTIRARYREVAASLKDIKDKEVSMRSAIKYMKGKAFISYSKAA